VVVHKSVVDKAVVMVEHHRQEHLAVHKVEVHCKQVHLAVHRTGWEVHYNCEGVVIFQNLQPQFRY
jgi:hypothetical protein